MGSLLSLPASLLNLILPFTDKSTPLIQDLIHTAVLCGTLYFGPQLVELYQTQSNRDTPPQENDHTDPNESPAHENLIFQPDQDANVQPPPLAPTPPPDTQHDDFLVDRPQHHDGTARTDTDNFAAAFPDHQPQQLPGPAHDRGPRPTPQNRTIGTKKAKSLARKDERRAYFEFHRQEAELRRQREAQGRSEREALLAAEKARRTGVERVIEERNRAEREWKKEQERVKMEEERVLRDEVVRKVREQLGDSGAVNLVDMAWKEGKDLVWIERLVRASGLLVQMSKDGLYAMITSAGWALRLDARLMQQAYADAAAFGNAKDGKVSFEEFGGILERCVRTRAKA